MIDYLTNLISWLIFILQTKNWFLVTSGKKKITPPFNFIFPEAWLLNVLILYCMNNPRKREVVNFVYNFWSVNSEWISTWVIYVHLEGVLSGFWFHIVSQEIWCFPTKFHQNLTRHSGVVRKFLRGMLIPPHIYTLQALQRFILTECGLWFNICFLLVHLCSSSSLMAKQIYLEKWYVQCFFFHECVPYGPSYLDHVHVTLTSWRFQDISQNL